MFDKGVDLEGYVRILKAMTVFRVRLENHQFPIFRTMDEDQAHERAKAAAGDHDHAVYVEALMPCPDTWSKVIAYRIHVIIGTDNHEVVAYADNDDSSWYLVAAKMRVHNLMGQVARLVIEAEDAGVLGVEVATEGAVT